jgi:hypothetical protein
MPSDPPDVKTMRGLKVVVPTAVLHVRLPLGAAAPEDVWFSTIKSTAWLAAVAFVFHP